MKYTIEGFSQEYACSLRKEVDGKTIKLDCTDLVILRWFVDFYPKMMKVEIEGVQYAWISYSDLLRDMPLLDIQKRMLASRLQKMADFEILKHKTAKANGTFSYYGFGKNYAKLVDDAGVCHFIDEGSQKNDEGVVNKMTTGSQKNDEQINPSTKDPSIKNNTDICQSGGYDYDFYMTCYNEICTNLPKILLLNDDRKTAVVKFEREFTTDDFKEICRKANRSQFLTGKIAKGNWKANFEFLLRPDQAVKILEGSYDDAPADSGFEKWN
jgi:hypothetical protein